MAKRYLIIDGYNFMHAAGMFPQHVSGVSLEQARKRLFHFLAGRLSEQERSRTEIVFDVRRNRSDVPPRDSVSGMQIRNAVDYPDADSLIEKLIAEHPAPKQLLVVSGDHRLQRAARRRKARAIDSEPFFDQLEQRTPFKSPRKKTLPPAFPHELISPDQLHLPPHSIPDELAHWEQRIQELFDE